MPFETLPGNTHIQVPNIPWSVPQVGPHDYEPRDPNVGLRTLKEAMASINESIKDMSPLERSKKEMQMMQIQYQRENFQGYKDHPELYILTAHGPVPRDPYTMAMNSKNLQLKGLEVDKYTRENAVQNRMFNSDENAMSANRNSEANAQAPAPTSKSKGPINFDSTKPVGGSPPVPAEQRSQYNPVEENSAATSDVPTAKKTKQATDANGAPIFDTSGQPVMEDVV